jgi:hypothetical protein
MNEGRTEMKYFLLLMLSTLLLAGCEYQSPLTSEHNISADTAVLGLWDPIPERGEESEQTERMMILKYSDTEYLIHYPVGKHGLYYRGYPIELGGISCVQLQILGTGDGPPAEDEKELYHVVSYQLGDGKLEIRTLNTDLVGRGLKTTEALVRAFLDHRDDSKLFTDFRKFRRIDE